MDTVEGEGMEWIGNSMVIHNPKIYPHSYLGSFLGIASSDKAQWAYIFCNFLTVISGILGFMPCQCACVARAN